MRDFASSWEGLQGVLCLLFWVLDSGWGQIGGKGVLNLGNVEGTKILRNEDETSVAAIVLVFRLQATELTCQGRVLAGIRGRF